jgi:hypothetical protein
LLFFSIFTNFNIFSAFLHPIFGETVGYISFTAHSAIAIVAIEVRGAGDLSILVDGTMLQELKSIRGERSHLWEVILFPKGAIARKS